MEHEPIKLNYIGKLYIVSLVALDKVAISNTEERFKVVLDIRNTIYLCKLLKFST